MHACSVGCARHLQDLPIDACTIQNSSGQWSRTGRLRQLVTLPSASPGRPWEVDEEFIIGLEGDHSTLVKLPDYYGERRYERISDVLEKFLTVATDVVASRFQLLSDSTSLPSSEKMSSELASAKRKYGMALSDDEKELVEQKKEKKRRGEYRPCGASLNLGYTR